MARAPIVATTGALCGIYPAGVCGCSLPSERAPDVTRPRSNEGQQLTALDDRGAETAASVRLDVATLGARAVVQLSFRTVATRLITLAGTIALARLLSPAEFGAFAVVTVFVSLIAVVGDLGIGAALIQQERPPTGRELSTAFTVQLLIWTTIALVISLVGGWIPVIRPDLPPETPEIARLLAFGLFLVGLRAIPTVMLTRVLRFGPLAAIEILQQVAYFGVAVALAAEGLGVRSFAIAAVAQSIVATVAVNAVWRHWFGLGFERATARRLLGFGIGYQAAQILVWARDAVVPLFGGLAGGLAAVGFLGFAWRNGQLVTAVEQIISRVAFPAFNRLQSDRARMASAVVASVELAVMAVCLIQGWIIATAAVLVPVVFSGVWTDAVVPLQLVCLGSLAGAPTYVLRSYMYARGESRRALVLVAASLVVLAISFPLLATLFGLVGAATSFVLSAVFGLLLFIHATRSQVRFPWRGVARIVVLTLLCGAIAALVVRTLDGLVGVIVSGIVYMALAAIGLWVTERRLVRRARAILIDGGSASES